MKKFILYTSLRLLSLLPLSLIRGLGAVIGLIALHLSKKSAQRLPHNLLITGLATPSNVTKLSRATAMALGMTLTEAALIAWSKNRARINRLVSTDASFAAVKAKLAAGQNIVFLTPHIGNFEIAVKYFAYNLPMALKILYKPAKDPVVEELIFQGRSEENLTPVPTNRYGVLNLIKHLKSGGSIGILPDNVASAGDGEWVNFFGQHVYATSLAAKICQMPGTEVIVVQSLRTKHGFKVKCIPFVATSLETHTIMQQLYNLLEQLIIEAPEQYYWSYDRFRHPTGAKAKPAEMTRC